jgi:hypothetical protein
MSADDRSDLEGQMKFYADRPLLSFTNRKKMHLIGGNELARVHDFVVVVAGRDDDPLRRAKGKPQRFWIAEILEFKLQDPDDAHLIVRWFHANEEFGVYVGAVEHGPRGGKKHFRERCPVSTVLYLFHALTKDGHLPKEIEQILQKEKFDEIKGCS